MWKEKRKFLWVLLLIPEWFVCIKSTLVSGCSTCKGPWGNHIHGLCKNSKEACAPGFEQKRGQEVGNDSKVLAREVREVFVGHETNLMVLYVWNHSKSLSNEIGWSDFYYKKIFSTLVSIRVTCRGFSKCHETSQRLWEYSSGTRLVSTVNSNIQLGLTTSYLE